MNFDPKPVCSPRTILTNIEYHQSLIEKYQALIREEEAKVKKWQQELSQQLQSQL